jgi:hypothetical protein
VSFQGTYDLVEVPLDGSPMRDYLATTRNEVTPLVFGIRSSETQHLVLESIDPETAQEKPITDFGPVPPSMRFGELNGTTAFRGFSTSPGGRSFLTSAFRSTSDIWMLEGFR